MSNGSRKKRRTTQRDEKRKRTSSIFVVVFLQRDEEEKIISNLCLLKYKSNSISRNLKIEFEKNKRPQLFLYD